MKALLIVLTVIIGSFLLWNYAKPEEVKKTIETIQETVSTPKVIPQTIKKQYEFIPYWTFTRNITTDSEYSLIYFGISVDEEGINRDEDGFKKLRSFIDYTPNAKERILAVRMTDKVINAKILKEVSLQEKIASDAVKLAQEYSFEGVLLDYETSAFGFDSTTNNITAFFKLFSDRVKSENLQFSVTLYGDTYFRARPYDVKKIGEISDKVIIMAYDFSKSRGNPGPNFPLIDNNEYGYSFEKMVSDFQKDVDNSKLVVALGYFGYDWVVSDDGTAVANGVPLSTNEIVQNFVDKCEYENCYMNRSSQTSEPSITYIDKDGESHTIWYEDNQSAQKKKEFLKSKGILEIADWAYSYH